MADVKVRISNIRFEAGKLWKPRYDSLIDYCRAPRGFQFEPSFTLRSAARNEAAEVDVLFEIAPGENVVFDALNGKIRWDLLALNPPSEISPVEVEALGADNRACLVRWRRTGAFLTVLRIRCRYEVEPAMSPEDRAWSVVEGGVYLVMIDPGEELPNPEPALKVPDAPAIQRVRLLGIDEHHRPVYDLYYGQVPPQLVPEPAFRAAHGESLDFRIALDLPDTYADTRFKADDTDQAEMFYAVPLDTKPEFLAGVPVGEKGKECTMEWRRPGLSCQGGSAVADDPCFAWNVVNFYAELGFANTAVRIDPTVIEPPACDASGVCGPPRGMD